MQASTGAGCTGTSRCLCLTCFCPRRCACAHGMTHRCAFSNCMVATRVPGVFAALASAVILTTTKDDGLVPGNLMSCHWQTCLMSCHWQPMSCHWQTCLWQL
eukprot:1142576-Pelagomonas_calceolata.AAC.4